MKKNIISHVFVCGVPVSVDDSVLQGFIDSLAEKFDSSCLRSEVVESSVSYDTTWYVNDSMVAFRQAFKF